MLHALALLLLLSGPAGAYTIQNDRGGKALVHHQGWTELQKSGEQVEILGPCLSACAMVMAYIPRERICFGRHGLLGFHQARVNGQPQADLTHLVFKNYPKDIMAWIDERGGIGGLPEHGGRLLIAPELWDMGYKRC